MTGKMKDTFTGKVNLMERKMKKLKDTVLWYLFFPARAAGRQTPGLRHS